MLRTKAYLCYGGLAPEHPARVAAELTLPSVDKDGRTAASRLMAWASARTQWGKVSPPLDDAAAGITGLVLAVGEGRMSFIRERYPDMTMRRELILAVAMSELCTVRRSGRWLSLFGPPDAPAETGH